MRESVIMLSNLFGIVRSLTHVWEDRAMRTNLIVLFVSAAGLAFAGCSGQEATSQTNASGLDIPTLYDEATADQYGSYGDDGYRLLDEGKLDEAVASFTKQHELIPTGKWGAYNVACAYGRTGDLEQGFVWLTRAVDSGWDDPDHLQNDGDLESLRADARFAALVGKAEATRTRREAAFANGLPEFERPPISFPSADSLEQWSAAQRALIRTNRSIWFAWQNTAYQFDFEARRLAALRELEKDSPDFEYGLERVRAISKTRSIWSAWGPLAQGVLREVGNYKMGDPSVEGLSEAEYRAGIAAWCEMRPMSPAEAGWATATAAARAHFAQVKPGTKYEGAALAWQLGMELDEAGENRDAVLPKVRDFASRFASDEIAMDIAGSFFQSAVVAAVWPIPINGTDIDGQAVSLDDFKGKVVLVDFWATWCGPCRAELPHILAAHEKYQSDGFEVLSISLDYANRTNQQDYRDWINEKGMKWRHIYDEKDWSGPLVEAYMVKGIPSPFLVGRDGSLVASGEQLRGEKLAETVARALDARGA